MPGLLTRAGTVMTTFMTYWMEDDSSKLLPVRLAIVKT